jgi:hypothetical protein
MRSLHRILVRAFALTGFALTALAGASPRVPAQTDAALPAHVRSFAYYGLNDLNSDVPAAYMAAHVDIVEDDGFTAQHADAFKRAGGKIALAYTDPSYVPHCPPPFTPPAGKCEGPIGNLVARDERAWMHDATGARVRRFVSPYFQNQEALNPASPVARDAYRRTTDAILAHSPRLDGFFADDSGSPYSGDALGSNHFYEFNARAVELPDDRAFIAAESAMLAAPGKPVIVNGGDPATFGPAYGGVFLDLPYVMGQMFEGCYNNGDSGPFTDARNRFAHESDGLLAVIAKRKLAVCLPTGPSDPPHRTYAYAAFLLTYDPSYSVFGMKEKQSDGRAIYPETELVPGSPRQTARAIADLRRGAVYVREFARCALGGVPAGPCATVVNPSLGVAEMPLLPMRYGRHAELDSASSYGRGRVRVVTGVPRLLESASAVLLMH